MSVSLSRTYSKIGALSLDSSSMKLNPYNEDEDEEESFIVEYPFTRSLEI